MAKTAMSRWSGVSWMRSHGFQATKAILIWGDDRTASPEWSVDDGSWQLTCEPIRFLGAVVGVGEGRSGGEHSSASEEWRSRWLELDGQNSASVSCEEPMRWSWVPSESGAAQRSIGWQAAFDLLDRVSIGDPIAIEGVSDERVEAMVKKKRLGMKATRSWFKRIRRSLED
jgi:hypothetical protein